MRKLMLLLLMGMFFISFASAQIDTGTVKQGDCIDLYQSCPTCTYSDVRAIKYPNGSTDDSMDWTMVKNNSDYTYSFCNTSDLGVYTYTVYGNKGGLSYESTESGVFEVTGTGFEFNLQRMWLSLGMLGLFVILFAINLFAIPLLPNKNNTDEDGTLISINQLKYLRPILYVTAYFLLVAIMFIGSNLSLAYLGTTLLGDLLYKIFYAMMALAIPMLVMWFIYIFYSIFQDKQMKDYIERGIIGEKLPEGRWEW